MEFIFAKPLDEMTAAAPSAPIADLVAALNDASQAVKLLSSPASSQVTAALASLRAAHHAIGSILSLLDSQPPVSADKDELMVDRAEGEGEDDDDDDDEGSRIIDEVEEGMREFALQSKRRKKRQAPPTWPGERVGDAEEEVLSVDPAVRRRSAVDLVFQFHA